MCKEEQWDERVLRWVGSTQWSWKPLPGEGVKEYAHDTQPCKSDPWGVYEILLGKRIWRPSLAPGHGSICGTMTKGVAYCGEKQIPRWYGLMGPTKL